MTKEFKDWIDEFVENGANPKDVTNWPKNAGGEGGMVVVDDLPEEGDPTLLYKLPDGTIWSCVNKTETRTICDLKVGQSYKLVENIAFNELQNIYENITLNHVPFVENQEYPEIQVETDAMTGNQKYQYCTSIDDTAYYYIDYESAPGTIDLQYTGAITESPDVEITQYFVNNLQAGATLEDLIPLFQNSSHTEEVTYSEWSQINGGKQLYQHTITLITGSQTIKKSYASLTIINSSASQFTISGVFNYFKDKGFKETTQEHPDAYYPATGVFNSNDSYAIYGIFVYIDETYGEEYLYVVHLDSNYPDNFTPEDIIDTVIAL